MNQDKSLVYEGTSKYVASFIRPVYAVYVLAGFRLIKFKNHSGEFDG